tara:strand:+ start:4020 stop:4268 length:249 start_codon:yes stop_codon:yes gene_type:complete
MKIKENELKTIQEQQEKVSDYLNKIGFLESQKHALLHELAGVNKEIQDFKESLQKEYGDVNISIEDGTYTKIEEDVEGDKEN